MDYRLPDGTGAEATRAIKARWPAARVVMLTALNDDETILESIQAGADGYLTKDRAVEDVVSAVRAANAGETLLPRSVIVGIAQRVAAARDRGAERQPIEPLTPRELEVLRALTEGLSTPEICERLFIAPNTLRTHVQNIMGKLRVHSKLEAVAFALRHRLVEPPTAGRQPLLIAGPSRQVARATPSSCRRRAGSGIPPADLAAVLDASLLRSGPAARVVRRVLPPVVHPPLVVAPVHVEECAAARAAPLLGEQRVDRSDGVDLAATRPAGELRHVPNPRSEA